MTTTVPNFASCEGNVVVSTSSNDNPHLQQGGKGVGRTSVGEPLTCRLIVVYEDQAVDVAVLVNGLAVFIREQIGN